MSLDLVDHVLWQRISIFLRPRFVSLNSGGLAFTNVGEIGITDFTFMKTAVYRDSRYFLRECRVLVHEAEEQAGGKSSFEYSAGHSREH